MCSLTGDDVLEGKDEMFYAGSLRANIAEAQPQ